MLVSPQNTTEFSETAADSLIDILNATLIMLEMIQTRLSAIRSGILSYERSVRAFHLQSRLFTGSVEGITWSGLASNADDGSCTPMIWYLLPISYLTYAREMQDDLDKHSQLIRSYITSMGTNNSLTVKQRGCCLLLANKCYRGIFACRSMVERLYMACRPSLVSCAAIMLCKKIEDKIQAPLSILQNGVDYLTGLITVRRSTFAVGTDARRLGDRRVCRFVCRIYSEWVPGTIRLTAHMPRTAVITRKATSIKGKLTLGCQCMTRVLIDAL